MEIGSDICQNGDRLELRFARLQYVHTPPRHPSTWLCAVRQSATFHRLNSRRTTCGTILHRRLHLTFSEEGAACGASDRQPSYLNPCTRHAQCHRSSLPSVRPRPKREPYRRDQATKTEEPGWCEGGEGAWRLLQACARSRPGLRAQA